MMKLVYLSRSIIPSKTANSIHVMKMCQAFSEHGNQVVLLGPTDQEQAELVSDIFTYYGVNNSFEVKKIPVPPLIKGSARLYGFLCAFKAKLIKADIAYGRCLQSCFFSALLGIPVAYEAHQTLEDAGKITRNMFAYMVQSKHFRQLIVISEALAKYYNQQHNIPESLITVAHDGADRVKNLSQIIPVDFPNANQLKVGYVGHLYPGKGMEIISELAKACSWADFHIIGGQSADIDYWKQQLKAQTNIYFYGFVPHGETEQYRQGCDVLIAPYLRNVSTYGGGDIAKWMSPLKIFEYMASAKPILASDLPVLREVLDHEKTALLCNPDDINDWVDSLKRLNQDKLLQLLLVRQAKSFF